MPVPIVGAVQILLWYPTVLLKCPCTVEGNYMILITVGAPAQCPGCKKTYRMGGYTQGTNGVQPLIEVAPTVM